jgi:enamine deaminase RidA (YjgF/YER057c/UK114 family)
MTVKDRLQALGIVLPPVAVPAAAYVPFVRTGSLVFLSGHIAKQSGKPWVGQLGLTMATEEGKAAARAVAVDLLGTLQAAVGDLARVKRIVKVLSLVNSTATLHRTPPRHQRLQRTAGGGLRPADRRTCAQRLWRGAVADGRLRGDRTHRRVG